jgi:hypothetical protein
VQQEGIDIRTESRKVARSVTSSPYGRQRALARPSLGAADDELVEAPLDPGRRLPFALVAGRPLFVPAARRPAP